MRMRTQRRSLFLYLMETSLGMQSVAQSLSRVPLDECEAGSYRTIAFLLERRESYGNLSDRL